MRRRCRLSKNQQDWHRPTSALPVSSRPAAALEPCADLAFESQAADGVPGSARAGLIWPKYLHRLTCETQPPRSSWKGAFYCHDYVLFVAHVILWTGIVCDNDPLLNVCVVSTQQLVSPETLVVAVIWHMTL